MSDLFLKIICFIIFPIFNYLTFFDFLLILTISLRVISIVLSSKYCSISWTTCLFCGNDECWASLSNSHRSMSLLDLENIYFPAATLLSGTNRFIILSADTEYTSKFWYFLSILNKSFNISVLWSILLSLKLCNYLGVNFLSEFHHYNRHNNFNKSINPH